MAESPTVSARTGINLGKSKTSCALNIFPPAGSGGSDLAQIVSPAQHPARAFDQLAYLTLRLFSKTPPWLELECRDRTPTDFVGTGHPGNARAYSRRCSTQRKSSLFP